MISANSGSKYDSHIEPRTFLLRGDSANHYKTVLLIIVDLLLLLLAALHCNVVAA